MAQAKRGRGRPSSYDPAFVEQARKLALLGATDEQMCDFFGCSVPTLAAWREKHPEFLAAIKEAKAEADNRVEQTLFRRATGYTVPVEKVFQFQGKIIKADTFEHVTPDTTAAIFWLKNRKPAEWRDVKASELSGPGGGAIPLERIERKIVKAHD